MAYIPITAVRYGRKQGQDVLQTFIYADRYGGARVPRGVDPAVVSDFIVRHVQPTDSGGVFSKVAAALRFYERPDVLPHLKLALTGHESTDDEVRRSAFVVQSIGDLGSPDEAAQVADYLDRVLVQQPQALNAYQAIFEAFISIAPTGSPERLMERLSAAVNKAAQGQRTERGVQDYQRIAAVERNEQPRNRARWQAKTRLAQQAPDQRRNELAAIYLRQSPASSTQMEEWAARMLRAEAMQADPQPVYAIFGRVIDTVDPLKMGAQIAAFTIVRAAQAILYLQGKLSPKQEELYEKAGKGAMNFLWDDLQNHAG
ncbi:MAG TPA: hypothetical protein VKR61_06510 [Bryobacteraceae bacterium]|nr:hypothetical protein [Bryobacteraceae bacterium]